MYIHNSKPKRLDVVGRILKKTRRGLNALFCCFDLISEKLAPGVWLQ